MKISKLQGMIKSIAFTNHLIPIKNIGDTSIIILVGTSIGFIYEISITSDNITSNGNGTKSVSKEKYCRVAHKLEYSISITSLSVEIIQPFSLPLHSSNSNSNSNSNIYNSSISTSINHSFPSSSTAAVAAVGNVTGKNEQKLLILCGTYAPTRLYNFVGLLSIAKKSFLSFFTSMNDENSFIELPSTNGRDDDFFNSRFCSSSSRLQYFNISSSSTDISQKTATMTTESTRGIGINELSNNTKTTTNNNFYSHKYNSDGQIFAFMTPLGIYHGPLHLYDTYVHKHKQ